MEAAQSLTPEEIAEFAAAQETVSIAGTLIAGNKEVRTYDFAKPDKLSKAHLKVARMMFSCLERSWSATLTSVLRTETVVTLNSVEQATIGAYGASLPSPVLLAGLNMDKLPGTSYIDMPAALAISAVDRLTGGNGRIRGEARSLTELETTVVSSVFERLISDLSTAFRPVIDTKFRVSDFFKSLDEVEIPESEVVLIAGFCWTVASKDYNINFVIPGRSIDAVRDLLTPERFMSGNSQAENELKPKAPGFLNSVAVKAVVELGRTRVSMKDIVGMGIGDVIRLERSVNDLLDVSVQGAVKFQARPGLSGTRMAAQIIERIRESERKKMVSEPDTRVEEIVEQFIVEEMPSGGN